MTLTTRGLSLALGAVAAGALAVLSAQQPARDTPAAPPPAVGTASVVGSVVFDETPPTPARRAAVTLTNPESGRAVRVFTDDAGRFVLSRLPAGRYLLAVAKGGQVPVTYGAARLGLPGSAIALAEGQTFATGAIKMTRGAVITGTVRGAMGRPMPGLTVRATAFQIVGAERRASRTIPSGSATTDDRGVYRIFGLAPGSYFVSIQTNGSANGSSSDMARATDAEFQYATAPRGSVPAPAPGPSVIFAPVLFPGVSDEAMAVPITLASGEEREGVDIRLQLQATARISGVLLGGDGQTMVGAVRLVAPGGKVVLDPLAFTGSTSATTDGTFALQGVMPGSYVLIALAAPMLPNGTPPPNPALWAMVDLQVTGQDMAGLTVSLQPMLKVTGRVVYESAKLALGANATIRLVPPSQQWYPGGPGAVQPDGTFTIEGITPGPYRVQASLATPGTFLKSAMLNGKDALDVPVEIRLGDTSGLVVTVADHLGEIAGTLVDGKGQPAPQFYVHVFPTDQTMWTTDSRRVKNARASTDGKYSIAALPAGEYYVCALTEYDPATASDPAFLSQLVPASFRITLADGEKKTQILRLAGG